MKFNLSEKNKETLMQLLAAGPFLLGWLPVILTSTPGSNNFRTAVRSLFITLAYFLLTSLNQFLAFVNFLGYDGHEDKGASLLVTAYIGISLYQYIRLRGGEPPLADRHPMFKMIPGENS